MYAMLGSRLLGVGDSGGQDDGGCNKSFLISVSWGWGRFDLVFNCERFDVDAEPFDDCEKVGH